MFPGATTRDTFTGAGQPVARDLGHTVIPDLQANRHESLYYGLIHFTTPIFMERDAPKAHAACC